MNKIEKMSKLNKSEIKRYLDLLGDDYIQKIPKKVYDSITKDAYELEFSLMDIISERYKLNSETIKLYSALNFKYFVTDEERRYLKSKYNRVNVIKEKISKARKRR